MTDEILKKERLALLLKEMQGDLTQRGFARKLKINYASLSAYIYGERIPEERNLEKIAIVKGWSRKELEAYLEDRQIEPTKSIDELLENVRSLSTHDAWKVLNAALDVIGSTLNIES